VTEARTKRARKLLAVETSRVVKREGELAAARRALEEREQAATEAEAAARTADTAWLEVSSTEELAQASARRRSLEARLVQRTHDVALAKVEVLRREEALVAARISERRFEILIEGFEQAAATRERKIERKAADEHAARRTGAS
jgi:flagellar biosynthesis chaperone FliJ